MAVFCITKSKAQIFGCCWRREVCSQITKITAKVIPYTDNVAIESYKNHSFLCLSSFCFCSSFSLPEGGNIGHDTKEIIAYGANDKRKEGSWEWTDSSSFQFEDWAPGQPSRQRSENCVELYNTDEHQQGWNDLDCEASLNFVCASAYFSGKSQKLTNSNPKV